MISEIHFNYSETDSVYKMNGQKVVINYHALLHKEGATKSLSEIAKLCTPATLMYISLFEINPKFAISDYPKVFIVSNVIMMLFWFTQKRIVMNITRPMRWIAKYSGFMLRSGLIEMALMNDYLVNKEKSHRYLVEVLKGYQDDKFMHNIKYTTPFRTDLIDNVKGGVVNAGIYYNPDAPLEENKQVLNKYVELNINALKVSTGILKCFIFIEEWYGLGEKHAGRTLDLIGWDDQIFMNTIAGRKILFVTALADLVNDLYATGDIFKVRPGMPQFTIHALNADVSLYPERPGKHWLDSFEKICRQIDLYLASCTEKGSPVNFFTAACGSYAIPLCWYVYTKYGIDSICYGSYMDNFFGVMNRWYEDYIRDNKIEGIQKKYFRNSDLRKKYPKINWNFIDGAKYLPKNE